MLPYLNDFMEKLPSGSSRVSRVHFYWKKVGYCCVSHTKYLFLEELSQQDVPITIMGLASEASKLNQVISKAS